MLNEVLLEGTVIDSPECYGDFHAEFRVKVGNNDFDIVAEGDLAASVSKYIAKNDVLLMIGELCGNEGNAWVHVRRIERREEDLYAAV